MIIGICVNLSCLVIILIIMLIAITMSIHFIILQILETSTLLITLLLLIELQWIRFPLIVNLSVFLVLFTRMIKYPIWELKSLLFVKEPSINIKSFIYSRLKAIYLIPLSIFFIYYSNRLFNIQILTLVGFQCYAVINRLNKAFSWQIEAIYMPRARYSRQSCCGFSLFLLTG